MERLPYIDEHVTEIAAPPERVWSALVRTLAAELGGGARIARALGCEPARGDGTWGEPVRAGQVLPGFRVAAVDARERLALAGRHRFSVYAATFLLEDAGGGRVRLRAQTHAAFPGLAGRAYRAAVIGSGAHRVVTRRLLRRVARHA